MEAGENKAHEMQRLEPPQLQIPASIYINAH